MLPKFGIDPLLLASASHPSVNIASLFDFSSLFDHVLSPRLSAMMKTHMDNYLMTGFLRNKYLPTPCKISLSAFTNANILMYKFYFFLQNTKRQQHWKTINASIGFNVTLHDVAPFVLFDLFETLFRFTIF